MRERIVPPYRRGILPLAIVTGGIVGFTLAAVELRLDSMISDPARIWLRLSPLGAPLLWTAWFSLHWQRRLPTFLNSFVFALACTGANALTDDFGGPIAGTGLVTGHWWGLGTLIAATVIALIWGLISLAIRWACRLVVVRLVEQDGSYCWRCVYRPGSPLIRECPECGTPIDPARFRFAMAHRATRSAARIALPAAAILGAAGAIAIGRTLVSTTLPAARFLRQFDDEVGPIPAEPGCFGAWKALPGREPRGLLMEYRLKNSPGQPAMRIWVAEMVGIPGGDRTVGPTNPPVTCELNRIQAEYAIDHGLPQSLVDSLLSAAPPVTGRIGWKGAPGSILIPVDGHFPR